MPGFIILGYVWQILGRGSTPPIREQPRKIPSWIGLIYPSLNLMCYHNISIWCRVWSSFFLITISVLSFIHLSSVTYFHKMFHKCFIISVTDNVCSWDNILYFLDQKAFLKPIWLYKLFCMYKSIFEFSYSDMISNFEFMIFVIMPNIIFNIRYTIPMTIFYHQFHKKINILFSEPVPLTCDRTYSKL